MSEAVAASSGGFWRRASQSSLLAAVAGAFIGGTAPVAADKAWSVVNDTDVSRTVALQNQAKWRENKGCAATEEMWHPVRNDMQLDATICPGTGDILVTIKDRNEMPTFYWWSLDMAAPELERSAGISSLIVGTAHAAVPPVNATPLRAPTGATQFAQAVMCQVQLSDRLLKRRLRRGDGCVDIIIDTFTGQTIRVEAAPCDGNC